MIPSGSTYWRGRRRGARVGLGGLEEEGLLEGERGGCELEVACGWRRAEWAGGSCRVVVVQARVVGDQVELFW